MSQTVGEVIYLAINFHPPRAMAGPTVTCECGWRGEGYLEHIAGIADSELHTAKYKLTDRQGREVPSNFR